MKTKKILHISKYYYPFHGGTEQIAQDCVQALKNLSQQKVLCFNESKDNNIDFIDGVEIIRAGCFTKIASQSLSFSYGNLLKQIINDFEPDIIIFHYPNPFVAYYLLKYISSKTKLVIYWHLDIVKQKILKLFFLRQNRKLLKRADKIIATSPLYIEGSPFLSKYKEKCIVIPNCINENRMIITDEIRKNATKIKSENHGKIICFAIGRHITYKGFKYLIEASKFLDARFKIFIGGKGDLTEKLKQQAANDKKIIFLGRVSDEDLIAYYLAMDIFCFPSITKNEAFGIALAEAMYHGKPAVTFTIPGSGVNYVCLNNENGIEVENRNVHAYAEAMRKLADDVHIRTKMGLAAKKRIEENFLTSQFTENISGLIKSL